MMTEQQLVAIEIRHRGLCVLGQVDVLASDQDEAPTDWCIAICEEDIVVARREDDISFACSISTAGCDMDALITEVRRLQKELVDSQNDAKHAWFCANSRRDATP
jgi:hypothetical protein